jgi:hypothetical protein
MVLDGIVHVPLLVMDDVAVTYPINASALPVPVSIPPLSMVKEPPRNVKSPA